MVGGDRDVEHAPEPQRRASLGREAMIGLANVRVTVGDASTKGFSRKRSNVMMLP